jgi:hypothetical protein
MKATGTAAVAGSSIITAGIEIGGTATSTAIGTAAGTGINDRIW